MSFVSSLANQMSWLSNNTPKTPSIVLNPENTVLSLHGYSLVISEFPQWYQSRLKSAEALMSDVLCGFEFPELHEIIRRRLNPKSPADWFIDDLTNRTPGYSFITDPQNELIQFEKALHRKIMTTPDVRNRFYFYDGGQWRPRAGEQAIFHFVAILIPSKGRRQNGSPLPAALSMPYLALLTLVREVLPGEQRLGHSVTETQLQPQGT
jgi:hypothetical protein